MFGLLFTLILATPAVQAAPFAAGFATDAEWASPADLNEDFDLETFLNQAEATAPVLGNKILVTGRAMITNEVIVLGSCWDYINAIFTRAGFAQPKRITPFKSKKQGPYLADQNLIQAGDWLYFINHSYGDVEHSAIFIGWTDPDAKLALMLSYAGGNTQAPARYREYDLTNVYNIIRPKP